MTTKRQLPESNQERVFVFDKNYRCDRWDRSDLYEQFSLTFKDQPIAHTADHTENAHKKQPTSQPPKEDANGSNRKPIFPDVFTVSLKSIKEYTTEKDRDVCIPLHSTIPLKKRRRMLYMLLESGEIAMDGLVDSEAFINAMSFSDYNAIKMKSDSFVIKEYPQPPFKIDCANAQLGQPISTADIDFIIGTDTFIILSKTSFPILGLNCMRNHQTVIEPSIFLTSRFS